MKNILLIILLTLGLNAQAYTIYHVGSFDGKQYNEILNSFLKQEVNIYAGIDPSNNKKYVTFLFDGSIEDFRYKVEYNSQQYNYILTAFEKAAEWGQIAKENGVKIEKEFLPNEMCSTSDYFWCKLYFMSYNNGDSYQVYWSLEDRDNIWTKDTTVYYNTNFIPNALDISSNFASKELSVSNAFGIKFVL